MNYKHSAYIWKLKAKLQRHELRVARAGFDVSLITVTALGGALENQAAKIAELEAAIRALRNVDWAELDSDDTVYCIYCLEGGFVAIRDVVHALDCPWLTSGKLVGE